MPPCQNILGPKVSKNQEYVPEPPLKEEKRKIYESHVLIAISISSKTYAFMGLLPDPNANSEKF